jgi:hypothetical protein
LPMADIPNCSFIKPEKIKMYRPNDYVGINFPTRKKS